MTLQRIMLEMGAGNALYGEDDTKAANRAVQDALHHSSISLFRSLDIDPATMQVKVTLGVQEPDRVDVEAVAATLPHGQVTVRAVKGGLNVYDEVRDSTTVVATAGVEAWIEVPERWMQN